jgi:hypothetical protein
LQDQKTDQISTHHFWFFWSLHSKKPDHVKDQVSKKISQVKDCVIDDIIVI